MIRFTISKTVSAAAVAAAGLAFAAPAHAQATRTWVSGVGDDVNPCSRTAPCKTFAGAISKTAAGGEINCLDPGGFGAVTIVKSMTISCPYTEGGALAGGNGITVNMPASTDVTMIRGLDIFGVSPPSNGIRFVGLGTLHVEDTVIRRFNAANSQGISVAPTGAAELYVSNSTIAENGDAGTGGGIQIQPGVGGSVKALLKNVRVHNNANNGIRTDSTNGAVNVVIEHSSFAGGTQGLNVVGPGPAMTVMVNESTISANTTGILASGTSGRVRVANTTITDNGTGISASGGALIQSYVNNRLDGNTTDGTFSLPALQPR
jgi:hypothetical protein